MLHLNAAWGYLTVTRCSAIAERPRCRVAKSGRLELGDNILRAL